MRRQLAFDAYEMLAFDGELLEVVVGQLAEFGRLGADGKLAQLRFVARRPG